ncbi:hypothetical protein BuS5_03196 [Desulfosarcina sp. BuS5]|nr:hypothetical protein [Desulfosarcina sp. BuS5]WDN90225.1 hypothetical protein BuS5_03196 [Desulfosarcina sp. BuS5]
MTELTDEKLMAYVDGELDDLETEEVRKALRTNAKARQRTEIFRESTTLLQKVYDAPFHEEVPRHLIDGIKDFQIDDHRLRFMDRIASWLQVTSWQPIHALAFSMILIIGIGTGWFAARLSRPELTVFSPIFQGGDFSRGMETTVSGVSFNATDRQARVTPIATFLDQHGHYCRQYEVVHSENGSSLLSYGVACRTGSGDWLTRVSVTPEPSDFFPADMENSYVPAGDDEFAATIFSELMSAPPLTIEQEEDLMRGGWVTRPEKSENVLGDAL